MEKETREKIIGMIRREVVPAMGCTEPVAVALCVAKAVETLGQVPDFIELGLSGNIIKNAMGVGIPGTGMIGLPIAVALGALIGKSEYGLEVLKDVSPDALEAGRKFINEGRIRISHLPCTPSNLHIEAVAGKNIPYVNSDGEVEEKQDRAEAVISGSHTNFILIRHNDEVLLREEEGAGVSETNDDVELTMSMVYRFATEAPLDEIKFILEAGRINKAAADTALSGDYGHSLGSTIRRHGRHLFGDTPLEHIICLTSAACDARMGGAPISVMSNSGSGNQGITCTLPVISYAEDMNADEETTTRALLLSHLTSIYIKQSLGRLSALCGCVVASTGASAGLVFLMGGDFNRICAAIKNMVANLTGMICDGAKPACAMKISSGVSTAVMSAMLAMNGKCVTEAEGIVAADIDRTIHNLTMIGRDAMQETDRLVLKIMVEK
ncbi:MAG: L-serine ammonia-lyase, iron-sulfur-dependent, subunit alpha [Muribaculaceae bacterium]|nr:L-serine ammonia-lyase, iron-sulfur-dependent, subunit alpha [Muribaculaceae bacterium]